MLDMIEFEVVEKHAWMTMSEFADVVALSQMTPGPISINCATYVGYHVGGILGSLLASFSIVLPFFAAAMLMMNKANFPDAGLGQNNICIIICAVTFIAVFFFKVNPMLMIALSGIAGFLFL